MAHIGIANRTPDEQQLMYDGKLVTFAPKGEKGSVRIVADIPLSHVESRVHLRHKTRPARDPATGDALKDSDGKPVLEHLPQLHGIKVFDVLSIEDALKRGAEVEEDPKVIALRQAKEADAKKKAELFAEFKAALVEEGWTPPQKAKEPEPGKGKDKGGK